MILSIRKWLPFLAVLLIVSCEEEGVKQRGYPVVNTYDITDITENGALLNGEVLDVGPGVIDHGFMYSLHDFVAEYETDIISLGPLESPGEFSAIANRNLTADATYYVRAYARSDSRMVFGQARQFVSRGSLPPTVETLSPTKGVIGDTVIVVGTGFSDWGPRNFVYFGNMLSLPYKANKDTLWLTVPSQTAVGENTMKIVVGSHTVDMSQKFELPPITLSGFTPELVTFGDTLKINVQNTPANRFMMVVSALGTNLNFVSRSGNVLAYKFPDKFPLKESSLNIIAGAQSVSSTNTIKLKKHVITSFEPAIGIKDTEVAILGDNFSPVAADISVTIEGKKFTIVEASRKRLRAKVPGGVTPGLHKIRVTQMNDEVISQQSFRVATPVIQEVSPLTGTWGTVVTIKGEFFSAIPAQNRVSFNNVQATVVSSSPTEIKVLVPDALDAASSTVSVEVPEVGKTTATGISFQLSNPQITSFTPTSGRAGAIVTLSGANFHPNFTKNEIKFAGVTAEIVSSSSQAITFRMPSTSDTLGSISVTASGRNASSADKFHLISPWKRIKNLPGSRRVYGEAFALGNHGYVLLGEEIDRTVISTSKSVFRYSPATNEWTQIGPFYFSSFGNSQHYLQLSSFIAGGEAFVGIGSSSGSTGPLMKYVPQTDSWTSAPALPAYADYAATFSTATDGYVTTGRVAGNILSKKTWEYNGTSGTWIAKADLPGVGRQRAASFSMDGRGYLVGGLSCINCTSTANYLADLWEYNPATNQWTLRAPLPGVGRHSATGFSINGIGYIVGGEIYPTGSPYTIYSKEVWSYTSTTNQWSQLSDFPGGTLSGAVAFVINNKAYVGTGISAGGSQRTFWEFDPTKL